MSTRDNRRIERTRVDADYRLGTSRGITTTFAHKEIAKRAEEIANDPTLQAHKAAARRRDRLEEIARAAEHARRIRNMFRQAPC